MDSPPHQSLPPVVTPNPPRSGSGQKLKKAFVPLGILGVLLLKFKALLIPVLKFFPVLLKTGGTMFLTIWLYAQEWGWWYALGFVLLILVHECGHLIAAKRVGLKVGAPVFIPFMGAFIANGLKVGAPVFIPFMGAFIALKEAPRNAWIEAQVGIGGPLLGTVGAVGCYGLYLATANPLFRALCYMGLFLNLFNLAPIGFLDGGRIVTALSPWLWVAGLVVVGALLFTHFKFLLLLILLMSLARLFFLFRRRTAEEARYFGGARDKMWSERARFLG